MRKILLSLILFTVVSPVALANETMTLYYNFFAQRANDEPTGVCTNLGMTVGYKEVAIELQDQGEHAIGYLQDSFDETDFKAGAVLNVKLDKNYATNLLSVTFDISQVFNGETVPVFAKTYEVENLDDLMWTKHTATLDDGRWCDSFAQLEIY
jgi:hypothetical protein